MLSYVALNVRLNVSTSISASNQQQCISNKHDASSVRPPPSMPPVLSL
jgi:hypothetical protein